MEHDTYLTIKAFSQGLYKEKGSRFIGLAFPVSTQDEIKSIIENIRKEHHSARHHCFAWILGKERLIYRASDDGEPSGSAGKPILGQINSLYLTNILVIVVRYFGGKLLGINGLTKAYKSAAESALKNSEIINVFVRDYYELKFPYSSLDDVMKLIKEEALDHSKPIFDLECCIKVNFRTSIHEKVLKYFDRIRGLNYKHLTTI
jgi:uncharacterized YigZ family protein